MKVQELLRIGSEELKNKKIASYLLDSEILLSRVLNKKKEEIFLSPDENIDADKVILFKDLIKRRSKREPVAYIIQNKEFWSKNFFVNNKTLIPRPETELMVEYLAKIFLGKSINILDIGTGTGCILISLLSELKKSRGLGIDISKDSIEIAKINARKHVFTEKIRFKNISFTRLFDRKFDLIVSNPPYIKKSVIKNLAEDIKNFEPKIALDGGNDGLDVIKKIIYKSCEILKFNGLLALEIGNEQYNKVSNLLKSNNFKTEYIIKDYKDNIRCILSRLIP